MRRRNSRFRVGTRIPQGPFTHPQRAELAHAGGVAAQNELPATAEAPFPRKAGANPRWGGHLVSRQGRFREAELGTASR